MNKKLLTLAFGLAWGMSSISFAAENPFDKVPKNGWEYQAVKKLVQAGLVSGYSDGSFQADKEITRFEMAKIVAKAMARTEKANTEQKALINKLAAEYHDELNNIGVRIEALEKKSDNVKFSGETRYRYNWDYYTNAGYKRVTLANSWRTRLRATGQINDQWNFSAQIENTQSFMSPATANTSESYLYVRGPIGAATVTAGRMPWFGTYGIVSDSTFDGLSVNLTNKKLKTTIFYGKEYQSRLSYSSDNKNVNDQFYTSSDSNGAVGLIGSKTLLTGVDFKYNVDSKTNFRTGYFQLKAVDTKESTNNAIWDARYWEGGFDTKLNDKLKLIASYCKSNAPEQNRGFFVMLLHNKFDLKKQWSFMPYIDYRNMQKYGQWDSTIVDNNIVSPVGPISPQGYPGGSPNTIHGARGWEVGIAFVPIVNTLLFAYYDDCKGTDNTNIRNRRFRADWYMYF